MRFHYRVLLNLVCCLFCALLREQISSQSVGGQQEFQEEGAIAKASSAANFASSGEGDGQKQLQQQQQQQLDLQEQFQEHVFPGGRLPAMVNPACITEGPCSELKPDCLKCHFNYSCPYGAMVNTTCEPLPDATCQVRPGRWSFFQLYFRSAE